MLVLFVCLFVCLFGGRGILIISLLLTVVNFAVINMFVVIVFVVTPV